MLDPRQKNRLQNFGLVSEEIIETKEYILDLMNKFTNDRQSVPAEVTRPSKRARLNNSDINLWSSGDEEEEKREDFSNLSTQAKELEKCLILRLSKTDKESLKILTWWKSMAVVLPTLASVARFVLCVPHQAQCLKAIFLTQETLSPKTGRL